MKEDSAANARASALAEVFRSVELVRRAKYRREKHIDRVEEVPIESINRVKRNLFANEPMDHSHNEFLEKELRHISLMKCKKWNFDFIKGVPLKPPERSSGYTWTKVEQPSLVTMKKYDEAMDQSTMQSTPKQPGKMGEKTQSKITSFFNAKRKAEDVTYASKAVKSSNRNHLMTDSSIIN